MSFYVSSNEEETRRKKLWGSDAFTTYSVCATLSPIILLVLYVSLFDMRRMYGLYGIPTIATIGLALLVLLIFNVIMYTVLFIDTYYNTILAHKRKDF